MVDLFRIAYLGELLLWVPLAAIVVAVPGMRRWLALPLGVSALAMAYEAFMTFVWAPTVVNPIRVDIFLVMAIAALVDLFTAIALWEPARSGVHRKYAATAALLCAAVPVLAALGLFGIKLHSAALDDRLGDQRRFRFEAAFRDDTTVRRFFGDLEPRANPWSGHYVVEGGDDRVRRLVINDAGQFWIFHEQLYTYPGEGVAADAEFRGQTSGSQARLGFVLRRDGDGYKVQVDGSQRAALTARRVEPPRFAKAASASDEVRFIGVFAGSHENPKGHPWVIQVWLWRSGDNAWGQYLREPFRDGRLQQFLTPQRVEPRCEDDCRVVGFRSGRGEVRLTRVSDDEWRAKVEGNAEEVALRRGELVQGFDLDLAPLATVKEHRRWLDAMTSGAYRRDPPRLMGSERRRIYSWMR